MALDSERQQHHPAGRIPERRPGFHAFMDSLGARLRRWIAGAASLLRRVLRRYWGGAGEDARLGGLFPGSASQVESQAQARRLFFFRFENRSATQADVIGADRLRRGGHVRLVFSDRASQTAAQALHGRALDLLALEGGRLTLAIDAPAGIELEGPDVVSACFESGRLAKEPGFDLHVTAECPDSIELLVSFFARGLRLYTATVRAQVQPDDSVASQRGVGAELPRPIDLDLDGASAGARSSMLLKASLAADGLTLTLFQFDADRQVEYVLDAHYPRLDAASLDTLLEQVRSELGSDFFDADHWSQRSPGSPQWRDAPALRECCDRVASAGWLLYQRLARADGGGRALLEHVERQPEGTRLTIATSEVLLPLELMYPQAFSRNWPVADKQREPPDPMRFWGVRFGVEVVHSGEGNYRELRQRHLRSRRAVSMNLNATITTDAGPQPREIHDEHASKLQQHAVECSVNSDCEAMRAALQTAATDACVIYVFCHGAKATPGSGATEALMLDFDCALRPFDLLPGRQFASAPVVILNACHAGAPSPLLFTSFLQAFRTQGALGVVATSFYVPILFGASFGALIIDACLERRRPLGEELRILRHAHARLGNLAPLFYSVQCQLDPS